MKAPQPLLSLTALVPQYASRFACVGPACEDNCCTGWQVTIDKKTFNAYRDSRHPVLGPRLKHDIKRVRQQTSEENYGRVQMHAQTQQCPFLEEKLCAIQRELGETLLSNTCHTYPKTTRVLGGQIQQALTLSCPEAARLALLHADAFDFVTHDIQPRAARVKVMQPHLGLSLAQMIEVQVFCIQLMRTQGLAPWERLAVLGVFCESLAQLLKDHAVMRLPSLIQEFVDMVESGAVVPALAGLPANRDIQAKIFAGFWQFKRGASVSSVQRMVYQDIVNGLGADPKTGLVGADELVSRYTQGTERLPKALASAPYLLENYILNEMFINVFPFDAATPYHSYLKLVSRYGLIRFMLAARCHNEQALPDANALVQTAQVFCRRFQHDDSFAAKVDSVLTHSNWSQLEKIYRFLRT